MEPYIDVRVYQNWRWNYNTGGGQLMDWIGHHGDIAHWGLGFDSTGPSEVEGFGEFPPANAIWNTATKYTHRVHLSQRSHRLPERRPHDHRRRQPGHRDGHQVDRHRRLGLGRSQRLRCLQSRVGQDAIRSPTILRKIKLYESTEHRRNFLDCVQSRKPTIAPVETAHHSTIPGHLGLISMLIGRKIHWDVAKEEILNDPAASELLSRPYRAPYRLA